VIDHLAALSEKQATYGLLFFAQKS
jgi:hypothetical protein